MVGLAQRLRNLYFRDNPYAIGDPSYDLMAYSLVQGFWSHGMGFCQFRVFGLKVCEFGENF